MKTLVIGAAIVDVMMWIDRLPKSGEDIPCRDTKNVIGGCAFNVASTMRNMNSPHDLCVPVGTGMHADLIRRELTGKGYPLLIEDNTQDNGYCLSLIESSGERTFITVGGAETHFRPQWFDKIDKSNYDRVYVAGYQVLGESGAVISDWLKTWNPTPDIFFAPGPVITSIAAETMQKFFDMHAILHINEKEALDFTRKENAEEAARAIHNMSGNLVIITLGGKGALFFDGKTLKIVPSEKVSVTDTVGAGDSHIGAVISGLAAGLDTEDAIRQANTVSGIIVNTEGPTISTEDFCKKMKLHGRQF